MSGDAGPPPARVALVTGGSGGIGAACAHSLAADGREVAVGYRHNRVGAKEVASSIEARGGRAIAVACDVTEPACLDAAVTEVESTLGSVTVVAVNAGVTADGLLAKMDEARWRAVLDTNLDGAYRTLRRLVPAMMRARFGRIVTVSSVGAFVGAAGQANYAAAKAGLIGLTRALARELAPRGVTANVVAPGPVATPMTEAVGDRRRAEMGQAVPLGRMAIPDEVAAAVAFLASDAASYITGAVLPVDGGLAMGT